MPRTTIMLSDELDHDIRVMAYIKRRPVAEVIRTLIAKGVEAEQDNPRELSFAGLITTSEPFDASKIDEYLEESWADDIEASMRG